MLDKNIRSNSSRNTSCTAFSILIASNLLLMCTCLPSKREDNKFLHYRSNISNKNSILKSIVNTRTSIGSVALHDSFQITTTTTTTTTITTALLQQSDEHNNHHNANNNDSITLLNPIINNNNIDNVIITTKMWSCNIMKEIQK